MMETSSPTPTQEVSPAASESAAPATSPTVLDSKAEKAQTQSLLAEARRTKEMLEHFKGAVAGGTFDGGSMLALAQGMAFVEAIINQNKAHIQNLQERLK